MLLHVDHRFKKTREKWTKKNFIIISRTVPGLDMQSIEGSVSNDFEHSSCKSPSASLVVTAVLP